MDNASDTAPRESPFVAFADFVLDTDRGVLSRNGNDVTLRPKSLAVLRVLLDNAGRLVTKEHLLATVWPASVVSDDTLIQSIGDIRRALGDDAAQMLKTLPRRGYLLDVTASALTAPAMDANRVTGPRRSWLRTGIFAALVFVSLLMLPLSWNRMK
ncbi:MAG: winged helix-turn-helix domain-containing protein, partial [Pseudomonadota bacterium]